MEEMTDSIKEFDKSHELLLGVPSWKVLLVLAYDGSKSMYQISKDYSFDYPVVHRATLGLEKVGWIRVVERRLSCKNVSTKIYGLTKEGLLWLFSRIPKTVHPSLVDFSTDDSLGLRSRMEEKDPSELANPKNLKDQKDVHLHLLFAFNTDKIAKSNTRLFPLIFERWDYYKETDVARGLVAYFPEMAFSTLVEYYYEYKALIEKLGTIEMLFAYKVYYAYLESLANSFCDPMPEINSIFLKQAVAVFGGGSQYQALFERISNDIHRKLKNSVAFIEQVKAGVESPK